MKPPFNKTLPVNNGFALVMTELYLTRACNSRGVWEMPFLNKYGFFNFRVIWDLGLF